MHRVSPWLRLLRRFAPRNDREGSECYGLTRERLAEKAGWQRLSELPEV